MGPMVYSILEVALPGRKVETAGVLLLDEESGRLGVKMRRDWERLGDLAELDEEDTALLKGIEREIKNKAAKSGAGETLAWLEGTLSNVFQLGSRLPIASSGVGLGFDFALHRLYREWVPTTVEPFVTHLPRYTLRAAAGLFMETAGEEKQEAADWVEAPDWLGKGGHRLSKEMFVAEVHGESMMPLIPPGSLCIFRKIGAGSRNGKRVLVEDRQQSSRMEERYTVKVYHSEKGSHGEQWKQSRIWLEPLNPAYPVLGLEEDESRYAVVAEYVGLLDS